MKSMKKAFSANKVVSSLKKRTSVAPDSQQQGSSSAGPSPAAVVAEANGQSPEAAAHNSVKAFCESGGNVQGDEILFLPPIVDAAESSPAAAAECARLIAKFLSKEYNSRPSWQYNALMLIRILVDNPGETFTRNLAERDFVETARKLLKHGRDSRVRQMTMETLDDFEHTKQYDPNLTPLVEMWKAQKEDAIKKNGGVPPNAHRQQQAPRFNPYSSQQQQNYFARNHANKRLPDAVELASRLEEARTSAKLLEQVVMNTPPGEMLKSDLIKEFADRCQSASRSIQTYMTADNPSPDNETMESLIDTNEQLQTALNQHQRAVLNARKQLGLNERGADGAGGQEVSPMSPSSNGHDRVLEWQQTQAQLYASGEQPESPDIPAHGNGKGKETSPYNQAGGSGSVPVPSGSGAKQPVEDDDAPGEDPFRDPQPEETTANQRHQFEPFNPGFSSADGSAPAPALGSSGPAGSVPRKAVGSVDATAAPKDNVSEEDIYDAQDKTKDPVYRY